MHNAITNQGKFVVNYFLEDPTNLFYYV